MISEDIKAFTGVFVTFIILFASAIVNSQIIHSVIRLFVTRPAMRISPKHVTITASCVVNLIRAIFGAVTTLVFLITATGLSCTELLVWVLGSCMLSTLSQLAVAVVILTEFLRVQSWFRNGVRFQMTLTVVLLYSAVIYTVVVLPTVFYQVLLADPDNPCHGFKRAKSALRVMPALQFLVPSITTLMSIGLLTAAYVTRPPLNMTPDQHHTDNATVHKRRQFPVDVVLAGVVTIAFHFVAFFGFFALGDLDLRIEWPTLRKVLVAGILLADLSFILVPCCWLLDPDIRATVCPCARQARAVDVQHGIQEPMIGPENERNEDTFV
ncbi:hypothetical protein BaRGS_00035642 [Batillaria attramentaria]|uniref:Vomeronasal type-1 receptor n=1 Tax=Batillaria attramentaria TaxID=370345 RepID=A0ABD0JDG8_9CAEN